MSYNLTYQLNPPYLRPYGFENFEYKKWSSLMSQYCHLSLYASTFYICAVHLGEKWMQNRQPFKLRKALVAWNVFLCLGSFLMFSRLWPELWHELSVFGVNHAICDRSGHSVTSSFWLLIFVLSKILEFGDTAFIVARKQKLIFLHWYHHITVAIYCFYFYEPFDPASRWFAPINAFIHTIMYGYYVLKALDVKLPKGFAKLVTSMQILQMIVGIYVNVISLYIKVSGEECERSYSSIVWAFLMYGSYLVLFLNFFRSAYLSSNHKKRKVD